MTVAGDLTEAAAWRVLDQIMDKAQPEVVKQGLTAEQLDFLIEESLLWARSSGKTASQNASSKPKMPSCLSADTGVNPT